MKARDLLRRMSWRLLTALLAGALCLAGHCAHAQKIAGPFPDEMGSLYLGNGQVLAAMHPRLLTKNAHVSEFQCAPTGTRVAYFSEVADSEGINESVGVAAPESGDNTIYYSDRAQGNFGQIDLRGWSDDAAYLAFQTEKVVGDPSNPANIGFLDDLHIVDLVHGRLLDAPLPYEQLVPQVEPGEPRQRSLSGNVWTAVWAPGVRLMAIGLRSSPGDWGICLFDPDHNSSRLLFRQEGFLRLVGWQDATHIAYRTQNGYFLYDLATRKSNPVPVMPKLTRAAEFPWAGSPDTSTASAPNNETLTLSESFYTLVAPNGDKVDTNAIMITRTGGPAKPSKLELDSFLKELRSGNAQFLSNGGFDRQGVYHVVYTSEGDLKVVDLLPRPAMPTEKLAAGEKLTCPEEIQITESDARQIGLGIMQWVMDNNEQFPPADGFDDELRAYVLGEGVFTSPNGVPFHYLAPADPKLADMDMPADTPLGEFDLPCQKVVLYADGHVKVLPKNSPGS